MDILSASLLAMGITAPSKPSTPIDQVHDQLGAVSVLMADHVCGI